MNRVTHFDITGEETEKVISFYEGVFGWKFAKWDGPFDYWMIETGSKDEPGINGGLSKKGQNPPMNTIEVSNIDETIEKVKQEGGEIIMEKGPIPGIGWFANFKDPQGNMFGIMQTDSKAQ